MIEFNQYEAMDQNSKQLNGRNYLRLSEAMSIGCCTADDIFAKAAAGELVVYAIASKWKAGRVYEIDGSIDVATATKQLQFRGPDLPPCPDPVDESYADWQVLNESRDQIFGNVIDYARHGAFKTYYQGISDGLQPVAQFVFDDYFVRPSETKISLDLNRMLKHVDPVRRRYIEPDPSVLVADELAADRLIVMEKDFRQLLGQGVGIDLSDLVDNPRWPPELGLAISAWRAAAAACTDQDKPKEFILRWLRNRSDGQALSNEARDRIATIANWDKSPGRTRGMDRE